MDAVAEVCACYGWRVHEVLEMESPTFWAMHERMTLVEYRRYWPVAHLTSTLLNALGGKSDSGEGLVPSKRFEVEDMLPPWARPAALTRNLPFTEQECGAIAQAIADKQLPSWAAQMLEHIMPLHQVLKFGG